MTWFWYIYKNWPGSGLQTTWWRGIDGSVWVAVVASPRSSEAVARSVLAGGKSAAKLAQMAAKFVLIPATYRKPEWKENQNYYLYPSRLRLTEANNFRDLGDFLFVFQLCWTYKRSIIRMRQRLLINAKVLQASSNSLDVTRIFFLYNATF